MNATEDETKDIFANPSPPYRFTDHEGGRWILTGSGGSKNNREYTYRRVLE